MRKIAIGMVVCGALMFLYRMLFLKPSDSTWMFFLVGSLVLFVLGMLGATLLPKTLSKRLSGRALATVQRVRQTNVMVNNHPQVELTLSYCTAHGEDVTATITEVMDFVTLSSVEVGMTLPIVYDPARPQKVAVAADEETTALLSGEVPPDLTARCIGWVRQVEVVGAAPVGEAEAVATYVVEYQTAQSVGVVTTFKALVTGEFMALFPVGGPIPIAYDPNDPQRAALNYDVDEATMAQLGAAVEEKRVRDGDLDPEMAEIARNGVQAKGVLLSSSATGVTKGRRTELTIRVKVTPPFGDPYEVEMNKLFDPHSLKALHIGAPLEVYYLPSDPHKLAIGIQTSLRDNLVAPSSPEQQDLR